MEVEGCALPDDRLYDLELDVWFQPSEDGRTGLLGVTASLASFAGKVHNVEFRPLSGPVLRGRSVGLIESIRYTGAVRAPVDGLVVERNDALRARPKLLNDSPYDRGWFCRLELRPSTAIPPTLRSATEVRAPLAEKIRTLRIKCFPAAPDVELYEIGAECSAVLARVDDTLRDRLPEDVLLLVTDDPTSPIELVRWSRRTGNTVLDHRVDGNLHQFLLRKEAPR